MTCYDALILFHPEALPHPSRTLFQPEVHSKGDHISKMQLRANQAIPLVLVHGRTVRESMLNIVEENQAFLLISAREDSLEKHAERGKAWFLWFSDCC